MARPSVVDEIKSFMPTRAGCLPWYERVTPDQAELLEAILAAWRSGEFGRKRKPAAIAIVQWLGKHGIDIGWQGVGEWLKKNAQ